MAGEFDDLQMKVSVDASGAEQGLKKLSDGVSKLDSDLAKLGAGVGFGDKIAAEGSIAEDGLSGIGDAADQASDKLAKVGTGFDLSAFGTQLDAAASKMQSFGAGLTVLAAPFELVGALSVKAFADFESGMGKIFTLLPDISKDAMNDMSQQIKDFSVTFAADIGTVQQSAYDALSAGIPGDQLFSFLQTAQKAAVAGSSDVGVAVNGLTSAMNAYQMSVDESGQVSDVFFKTVELGKIEFDTLSDYIGDVSPTASALGVSLEDVGAGIASITAVNPNASKAMTSLNNLFKQLATGGSDLDALFQQLSGTTFKNFIAGGGSLADAMGLINDYMQQTGTDAFNLTTNFESANAIAMLTGTNFNRLAEFTDKVGESAGATDKAYEKMSGTLEYSLNALKSQFQVMSIDIGEKLAPVVQEFTKFLSENAGDISEFAQNIASSAVPALESVFDMLKKGMDMFNGMSPDTRNMLAKILGIGAVGAAVGGPALFAAGTALSPIASIITLMGSLTAGSATASSAVAGVATEVTALGAGSVGATASVTGISGALAALGPAGIVAAAGIAVMGAAYATNFGGFADNINESIGLAVKAIEDIGAGDYESAGENMAKSVAKGFESVGDLLIDIIKDLPEFAVDAEKLFKGFKDGMREVGEGVGIALREKIEEYLNGASVTVDGFTQAIGDALKNYNWSNVASDISSLLSSGWNSVVPDVSGYVSSLESSLKGGNWEPIGQTIGDLIASGIEAKFGKGSSWFANLIGGAISGAVIPEPTTKVSTTTAPGVQYVASPTGVSAASLQYAGNITKGTSVDVSAATKEYAQLKTEENVAIKTWLEGMGKYGEDVEKYRTVFEKNNTEWSNKMKDASAAIGATTDTVKSKTKELQTFSSAQSAADAGLKKGEEFILGAEVVKLDVKDGVIQTAATSASGIAKEQQAAIAKKQEEDAQAAREAAQKKYDDAVENAAKSRTTIENTYNEDLKSAATRRDRAIRDLDTTDKDYSNKLKKIQTNYSDDLEDAASARKSAESEINDNIDKLSDGVKKTDSAFKDASAITKQYTSSQSSGIDALRQKYAELSGIAPDIIAQLSYDDLIRNLDLYGVSLDSVNAELGSSVQQLTQVASTVNDIGSTNAFDSIKKQFSDLKNQFESGKLSQDQYLDGLRKASAETDTLSRSTNILKGSQKDAVLSFERDIKESLRRVSAGTYGEQPIKSIGSSIDKLGSIQFAQETTKQIPKVNDLIEAYKTQGVEQGKAAALQFQLNDALSDGSVELQEAYSYLASYNRVTGQNADVTLESAKSTLEMMRSLQDANVLQQMVTDAQAAGGISAEELAGIQAQQARVTEELAAISGPVPAALQSVADAINALMQTAQTAANSAVTSANTASSAAQARLTQLSIREAYNNGGQSGEFGAYPQYASGGRIQKTGPIVAHEGEYVLNRNDVNDIKRIPQASNPISVPINIDMRGANIDKQSAQDIPRAVARATRKALGRVGA